MSIISGYKSISYGRENIMFFSYRMVYVILGTLSFGEGMEYVQQLIVKKLTKLC